MIMVLHHGFSTGLVLSEPHAAGSATPWADRHNKSGSQLSNRRARAKPSPWCESQVENCTVYALCHGILLRIYQPFTDADATFRLLRVTSW